MLHTFKRQLAIKFKMAARFKQFIKIFIAYFAAAVLFKQRAVLKVDWIIDVFNTIRLASGNSNDELCAHIEIRLLPCWVLHTLTQLGLKLFANFIAYLQAHALIPTVRKLIAYFQAHKLYATFNSHSLCVCFSFVFIRRNKLNYRSQLKLLKLCGKGQSKSWKSTTTTTFLFLVCVCCAYFHIS